MLSFDTETASIRRALLAPPLVCGSFCRTPGEPWIERWDTVPRVLFPALEAETLVGHNVAYDLAVVVQRYPEAWPLVFRAYDEGRIIDTMLLAKMWDLYHGDLSGWWRQRGAITKKIQYSLGFCAQRFLGSEPLDKGEDGWRLRYGELLEVPLGDWPERASAYAKTDADVTLRLAQNLLDRFTRLPSDALDDLPAQCRSAWALHLMSGWGMRVDGTKLDAVEARLVKTRDDCWAEIKAAGLTNGKGGMSRKSLQALVDEHYRYDPPRTKPTKTHPQGQTKTSADILLEVGKPEARAAARFESARKMLSYAEKMRYGVSGPIQPRVNTLLETGRTSMGGRGGWVGFPRDFRTFSLQTVPNIPMADGLRECFVPREGWDYLSADWAVAELRSLGQLWLELFGRSTFAELFQRDPRADPHLEYAIALVGKENAKKARKDAKASNFGFPGGMGVARFVAEEKRKYLATEGRMGGIYTEARGYELRRGWVQRWEAQPYFDWVSGMVEGGKGRTRQVYSHRYRGGVGYCDYANEGFQGLTADGAKATGYELARHCYLLPESPLYGCRVVNFVHDEFLLEIPQDGRSHEAGEALVRVMTDTMHEKATPDVPSVADPVLSRCWLKGAEPTRDDRGRLIYTEG